jgi:5-methylcytosine-specific restriction endonuclease McrA
MRSVLERPTLVLNRSWHPVGVTPVARALVMLWNDVARVVEPEEYSLCSWEDWARRPVPEGAPCIRASRVRLRVPEVLCVVRYDRLPGQAVTFSRRNVAKRDHHTCQYCGTQPGWGAITVDHVLPRAQGGTSSWTNCVAACVPCNARKGDRTPDQAGMRLRKRPIRPDWRPYYAAHGDGIESWSKFLSDRPALVSV